jgi:hypothetical protein
MNEPAVFRQAFGSESQLSLSFAHSSTSAQPLAPRAVPA